MKRLIFILAFLCLTAGLLAGCTEKPDAIQSELASGQTEAARDTTSPGETAGETQATDSVGSSDDEETERGDSSSTVADSKESATTQTARTGTATATKPGTKVSGTAKPPVTTITTKPPTTAAPTTTQPTTGTTLNAQFDIKMYVAYAKEYGESIGLTWRDTLKGNTWNAPTNISNRMSDDFIRSQIEGICIRLIERDGAEYFKVVHTEENGRYSLYFYLA